MHSRCFAQNINNNSSRLHTQDWEEGRKVRHCKKEFAGIVETKESSESTHVTDFESDPRFRSPCFLTHM